MGVFCIAVKWASRQHAAKLAAEHGMGDDDMLAADFLAQGANEPASDTSH